MFRTLPLIHRSRAARLTKLVVALAAFSFGGCECDPEVAPLTSQIYLDACAKPQRKVNGDFIGGFESCKLAFGDSDISVRVTQQITVTNPSEVALKLKSVKLTGDVAFTLESAPESVLPGLSGIIVVSLRPRAENSISATLRVLSDAGNTKQTKDGDSLVEIPITATGVDNGVPDILVEPADCDFGHVAVDGVHICSVEIRNVGTRGLVLDAVEFLPVEPAGAVFHVPAESTRGGANGVCDPAAAAGCAFAFTGRPPSPDEEIASTQSVLLTLRFTPDALGNYSGAFHIASNDPDEDDADINVTMEGIGVTPPTCSARVKSVNGVDVPRDTDPEVEPLDDVVLTLEDSTPSNVDGVITGWAWSIPLSGRAPGSTAHLVAPNDETTNFAFADHIGVDVAGTYTVRAQVLDSLGTGSVNECEVQFSAIPKDHFLVQLTWDTPENDLDLHVTQKDPGGRFCISNTDGVTPGGLFAQECDNDRDCNYATCEGGQETDWDGLAGHTEGDPSLDIDDINGFGPENTNVDIMIPGDFLVGVNEYGITSEYGAGATLRIFIFGRIAYEQFKQLEVGEWWEVALVHWPTPEDLASGVQPCVEDLDDGNPTDECG